MKTFVLLPFAGLLLAGCTLVETRPDPSRFYVLDAPATLAEKPASSAPVVSEWPLALAVARLQTPSYLDQPQIVSRAGGSRMTFSEFNRWLEPVDKGSTRVFANALASKIGATRVALEPTLDIYRDGVLVQVNVIRFDGELGGEIVLQARWRASAVHDGTALSIGERTLTVHCDGFDYQTYAAAMGAALDQFAGIVATELRSDISRGPTGLPVPVKGASTVTK